MLNSRQFILLVFCFATIGLAVLFSGTFQHDAEDARKSAKKISKTEFTKTLDSHEKWLAAGNCTPSQQTGIADMGATDFVHATVKTEHKQATFFRFDLRGLSFADRNLRCATFIASNLNKASFFNSDLRGAIFTHASLRGLNLTGADLRGAIFHYADMSQAVFQPKHVPQLHKIYLANNLGNLSFEDSSTQLYILKKMFKDFGYVQQEKKIIAALNRTAYPQSNFSSKFDNWLQNVTHVFKLVLFDYTSEFGSNAFRPLILLYFSFVLFSAIYFLQFYFSSTSNLFVVFPRKKKGPNGETEIIARINRLSVYSRFEMSIAYSLRSGLRLGFQSFDFGQWVRMLQHREYEIKSLGWLRTVSAVQSLLSLYLVALAILSAFGKPFDV